MILRWIFLLVLVTRILTAEGLTLQHIGLFGNYTTRRRVILRELEMQSGKPVTDSLLVSDRSWLIRSDFLDRIDFQLKPGRQPGHCDLLVIVKEKGHWSFSPGFHTNDLFGLYGGGTLKYRNLLGLRQDLKVEFEVGGKNRMLFTWSNPWFAGPLHLFSELMIYTREIPYPYRDYPDAFLETTHGIKLNTGKQFGRTLRIGLTASWEKTETDLEAVLFSNEESDAPVSAGVFFTADTRDWPSYPRNGYLVHVSGDHTWFGSGQTYMCGIFNLRTYHPVGRSDILAMQLFVQGYHHAIPVYKRLHLGGGDSVRGLPSGYMAGDRLVMGNIEYRFPIMYERHFEENLHVGYAGVIFFDLGSAWFSKDAWNIRDLRTSAGIGVHAIWDNYVIRGEYGTRGQGWGFINIGTSVHF